MNIYTFGVGRWRTTARDWVQTDELQLYDGISLNQLAVDETVV